MYNKLFTKILDSSIWLEPLPTRIVWITLLAAMDEEGYAHFSAVENLASRARVTVTQCNAAIKTLAEPDQNSCDPEYSGRRIERVPGGFIILNAPKYRAIANNASRRESTRLRVQKFREKKSEKKDEGESNADVTRQSLHPASPSEYASASELKGESEGNPKVKPETLARVALHFLNEKAGRAYRETDANLTPIVARLESVKLDIDGVKQMIVRQVEMWKGDPSMDEFLCPSTLFRKSNFDKYYDNRNLPVLALKKPEFVVRPPTQSELFKQRDILEGQLNILRNQHGQGPLAKPWSDEDKQRRDDLKKRIQEITDQIAKGTE